MRISKIAFFVGLCSPFVAHATDEGVPVYYQSEKTPTANATSYGEYRSKGYTKYVGQSGRKQVVGTREYVYQVPQQTVTVDATQISGAPTANGIATPLESNYNTSLNVGYTRRFADFTFKTGVNSLLEWDDMVFNEIAVGAQHNFSLRNFDLFAYAKYAYGTMDHGGFSMDYDLEAFDASDPTYGIFTVSLGDQSGKTQRFQVGLGAHHIWDIGGWKLTPSIGYEIFKHDLRMSNHLYPNPGMYLPLMTQNGDYVYGAYDSVTGDVNYYALPIDATPDEGLYQVCMSPQDIKIVQANPGIYYPNVIPTTSDGNLTTLDFNSLATSTTTANQWAYQIWGVGANDCVIIGGDGPIMVAGTTHIYDTTWSGFYIGLELEKQMTMRDNLRIYAQFGMPKYSAEGTWPNRTDWQQNPSFIDEGNNGAYTYSAEMEYTMRLADRLSLSLKVDTDYFYVGKIGGKLYVAEYTDYKVDETGQYVYNEVTLNNGNVILVPELETVAAHTENIRDSLKYAKWQSFGLHLGLKYAF